MEVKMQQHHHPMPCCECCARDYEALATGQETAICQADYFLQSLPASQLLLLVIIYTI
jgi:hypothetical protein